MVGVHLEENNNSALWILCGNCTEVTKGQAYLCGKEQFLPEDYDIATETFTPKIV